MAGMAYGRPQFTENCNLIGPNPMKDPQNWNLNMGLNNLAKDTQNQFHELNQKLDQVLHLLRQIQRNQ